jgi:DNA polymerase-3 subunit alpha
LFDFCKRVDRKQINRRTIESLIRAGAMDCFGVDRAILLASVGFAMEVAGQEAAAANQVSLFGGDDRPGGAAGIREGHAVDRPPEAVGREDRARLLPVGPHVRLYAQEVRRFAAPSCRTWNPRASRACCAA